MVRWGCALLLVTVSPLSAQRGWRWRPDERAILGDFSVIQSVAASRDAVIAATENGLLRYDRRFRRWDTPFTPADGYDGDQVVSAVIEALDETVWLGTRDGLLKYQPRLRQAEKIPIVGGVGNLVVDPNDPAAGVFFSTRFGWRRLGRGQLMPQEVAGPPPGGLHATSVTDALRAFPYVEAAAPTTLLDARLRPHRFTGAAVTPDNDEAWFGTDGIGLIRLDALGARLEKMPYGLLSQSVGAVTATGTEVIAGSGAGSRRSGLTVLDVEGQRFLQNEDTDFRSFRDIIVTDDAIWLATDRGAEVMPRSGIGRRVFDMGSGLPSNNVLALAPSPHGLWLGTDRGLARVGSGDSVMNVPGAFGILSLVHFRDTLWIGTTRGVMVRPDDGEDLLVLRDGGAEPSLREAIVALARLGDTLIAATGTRMIARVPGRNWTALPAVTSPLGTLRALAADSGGVWVGGERGLGFFGFRGKDLSAFRVPDDVPGAVQDLALHGKYLWVATPEGLVRFDRRALRL